MFFFLQLVRSADWLFFAVSKVLHDLYNTDISSYLYMSLCTFLNSRFSMKTIFVFAVVVVAVVASSDIDVTLDDETAWETFKVWRFGWYFYNNINNLYWKSILIVLFMKTNLWKFDLLLLLFWFYVVWSTTKSV